MIMQNQVCGNENHEDGETSNSTGDGQSKRDVFQLDVGAVKEQEEEEEVNKRRSTSSRHFANHLVIEVPLKSLKNIRTKLNGVGSVHRETKHFANSTTMHGPKRIFNGKRFAKVFWIFIVSSALSLLILQTVLLMKMYFSKPINSQVNFIVSEGGMDFPAVTICNFNPIKKTYVRELNASGDLSSETLEYLLQTNMDTMFLYSNLERHIVKKNHDAADIYFKNHPDFHVVKFLKTAGYECEELFKVCYFGGRRFDCCKYMKPRILSLGKCYQLDLQDFAPDWMRKQIAPGVEAGLQIIADANLEEEIKGENNDKAIFSMLYENGFRYYVHSPHMYPELSSEGVSVSPSRAVYSALKKITHNLLKPDEWGNCTDAWPPGYDTYLPYSATACRYLCLAQYYVDNCGCAPFTYNIDGKKKICTPYDALKCMDEKMLKHFNDTEYLELPDCSECHMECESISYNSFNSYGDGFNRGSLEWLKKIEPNATDIHIKENIAVINIFFMEMFYTSYSQVPGTSLTEILSDIGGNMGMFLGMSVITITEICLFFSKIFWIILSKKRRDYMLSKKNNEKEKENNLEEVVREFQERRSRRNSRDNLSIIGTNQVNNPYQFGYRYSDKTESNSSLDSMVELKIDMDMLRKKLSQQICA